MNVQEGNFAVHSDMSKQGIFHKGSDLSGGKQIGWGRVKKINVPLRKEKENNLDLKHKHFKRNFKTVPTNFWSNALGMVSKKIEIKKN